MWTAGLSITGTLLSLYATGVSAQDGVACNSKTHGEDGNSGLETSAKNLAMKLCDTYVKNEGPTPFIHDKGPEGIVLTITHSDKNPSSAADENCTAHFNEIVEQCIVKAGVWGGTVEVDGLLYEIYQDYTISSRDDSVEGEEVESRGLEARKTKKTKTKPKKTKNKSKKTKNKSKKTKSKKTKSKKTKSKKTKSKTKTTTSADACLYTPGRKSRISARGGCSVPTYEEITTELNDLSDTSDLVSTNPCNAVKRDLCSNNSTQSLASFWEAMQEQRKSQLFGLAASLASTLAHAERTAKQETSTSCTTPTPQKTFAKHSKKAIDTVIQNKPEFRNQKKLPISNSMENKASAERLKEWSKLSDSSDEPVAFQGKHFKGLDGDWLLEIFCKMIRMFNARRKLSKQDEKQNKRFGQDKSRDVDSICSFINALHFTSQRGKFVSRHRCYGNLPF
ncbi:hypothetical protein K504DRAFT_535182 [Pleomassaria siparia CBS 279.74]|uniref:Uncharacterized protein n=1 Tax=Pleomassaria siparia CBS 279.74 TaxID=1314801 RepID=A0A6G1K510_9PLEO|nr:hypothetical protein K504DRAFT_535182 [Pleomassaria siparia CBS 279.74]